MTRQVQLAAGILDIALRDHVIIGNGRWLSFRDEGPTRLTSSPLRRDYLL